MDGYVSCWIIWNFNGCLCICLYLYCTNCVFVYINILISPRLFVFRHCNENWAFTKTHTKPNHNHIFDVCWRKHTDNYAHRNVCQAASVYQYFIRMACALGYKKIKKFNELYNCICVCVYKSSWLKIELHSTLLILKLKHYNLFSSLTVAGFIRHTKFTISSPCCRCSMWKCSLSFCFCCFIFWNFFRLCLCLQSRFFPSLSYFSCAGILSPCSFLFFWLSF